MTRPTVSLVTLGCARNEVDSEELAARLQGDGWSVVGADDAADVVVVNTCGFVESAKAESIDVILDSGGRGVPVVAVGCMAERYGRELEEQLPEADAVIGFDGYAGLGGSLRRILAGEHVDSHTPRDRRELLPITPVDRPGLSVPPGHAAATAIAVDLPGVLRRRLAGGPVAPVKIASGCDRRCAFCAIPRFRGAFVSRPPQDVLAEAAWLADEGVREVLLVSENSTSYGKDLGDPRLLEQLLPALAEVPGIGRVRVSYLQPAEMRPELVRVIAGTPGVLPYFDLSFQHASGPLLRRMRRFGDRETFLRLLADVRELNPAAGVRSNVIVGFPGETEADVEELSAFLGAAELDAVGVFGYSAEEDTEAATLPGALDPDEISARVAHIADVSEHISAGRAAGRVGTRCELLVEHADGEGVRGRAEFQGPEDGEVTADITAKVGDVVTVVVTASDGVDLVGAQP